MIRTPYLITGAVLSALLLPAAPPRDFSADVQLSQRGRVLETMRLYYAGGRTRQESSMAGGTISIVRRDRGVVWMLFPARRQYVESPLNAQQMALDPAGDPPGVIRKQRLGQETAAGYLCTKYQLTLAGPGGREMTALSWHAGAIGMPVRTEVSGLVTEMLNIRFGPQPGHLFEIPAGYRPDRGGAAAVQLPANLPPGIAERMRKAMNRGDSGANAARDGFPGWVPRYAGSAMRGMGDDSAGSAAFNTRDAPETVAAFYEREFARQGIRLTRRAAGSVTSLRGRRKTQDIIITIGRNAQGEVACSITWTAADRR